MILDNILAQVRLRIVEQKRKYPLAWLKSKKIPAQDPDLFKSALARPGIQVIAEIKRASPSAGVIVERFAPVLIAREYASADVAAISVLTEEDFFQGSLKILQQVRQQVSTPLLRKDFIIDPYQIYQSKFYGANCILLIASILSVPELETFGKLAADLGLNTLVEIHNEFELETALTAGADIIGINNRDLKTFQVDLNTTFKLREKIPPDKIVVSESGIKNREQVKALEKVGIDAVLIGETLMRSENKKDCIRSLMG